MRMCLAVVLFRLQFVLCGFVYAVSSTRIIIFLDLRISTNLETFLALFLQSLPPTPLHLTPCPLPFSSVQFSSVAQSCSTLCNTMDCSTPGLPVHHQLLEFTQTHVHRVGDAIQPSHPRSSPSPPAPNPSQHQSLFQ